MRLPEPQLTKVFVGDSCDKLVNLMDAHSPMMSGVVHSQDSYMKGKSPSAPTMTRSKQR